MIGLLLAGALLASAGRAAEREAALALAPSGTLRAAINLGNAVLAQADASGGAPHGVSVDLARELGRRLGVPVELVTYAEAGEVAADAGRGAWDVAFLAIDPARAETIAFTGPYVVIEGVYVVPEGSKLEGVEAVDAAGVRVCVAARSAYDLYLSRALRQAQLVRSGNGREAEAAFLQGGCEALAGVKQALSGLVRERPGLRMLPGRFMAIRQAMAVPKDREAGLPFLRGFVAEVVASGFVRAALDASGQKDAEVAAGE
ncbi:MAG: transporter substrate-binding domain-containing protein [Acetobacteraceae bacterium]|nr:transporter substrate-binding domain-containing protein [Acetobacteraceae bacterium]